MSGCLCAWTLRRVTRPGTSRTIEIEDFVELDQIDPVYFDNPYYLAPDPARPELYAEAERVMVAQDARRRQRRQHRDAVAAAVFLQTYLDRRQREGKTE